MSIYEEIVILRKFQEKEPLQVFRNEQWEDLDYDSCPKLSANAVAARIWYGTIRVRPEPRDLWLVEGPGGFSVFRHRDAAMAVSAVGYGRVIHVREVID